MSESAKFECSLLLISGCRFKIIAGKKIELSEEFITLPIENGNEKMMVALSFKHVKKVEFLDNHEAKGAGLILHINDFMRKKLQDILDEGGTKLFDFKKQHSSDDALVIMDIVNSGDSKNLNRINNILYKAGIYHHNYIMKQMNSMNKKAKFDIPPQFISIIGYSQWTAVFSLLGIDIRNPHRNAPKKCNFGTSKLETTTEFVWTIDNFSERKEKCGECLLSPEFISAAPNGQILKWKMQIYPNGIKEEFKDYVSLNFLCLINEKVDAKYQIAIRKSDGDEFVLAPMNSLDKFGNTRLIKREDLLDEKNGCLDDDQLTIVCTLMVQQETGVSVGSLFEKSAFMDCKIVSADGKEISVHKSILSDRSPVFAAMFEHEMAERNSNTINIADMKMDVIEQMLDFIYSGKEPNMEEMVEDLLDAAEKYELKQLKVHCERKMIRSLGNANACESLLLANRYSLHHLRNHTINFIKMHLREVVDHLLKKYLIKAHSIPSCGQRTLPTSPLLSKSIGLECPAQWNGSRNWLFF